jgi:hypothetical protein
MATYQKFEAFVEHLAGGVHDLFGDNPGTNMDSAKIYLSNAAPNLATHAVKADLAEITTGNGYTGPVEPGGLAGARSGGTFTLSGNAVTITATGAVGPFRYVVLMNDAPTSPADPLIAVWDHGSAVELADGESFTWKPSNEDTGGTIFTLA